MRTCNLFPILAAMLPPLTAATPPSKRGLCHVPSLQHPNDDKIWTTGSPPLTWYYNYRSSPSPAYLDDKTLQFVPMLWGASATATDTDTDTGTPFLSSIKTQLGIGANITHVLAFNEPDGPYETGGCALPVDLAAARWKAELEPLRNLGVKVGLPAVTGGEAGWAWMEGFFSACEGGCRPDFVPVHWYGDFDGLMSHVGRVTVAYPHLEIWVTEFGFPGRDRGATEEFVRRSVAAFDGWGNVTRYAYFGAFRSDVSNVGPNAAMLDERGQLTKIGLWYVGGGAANHVPVKSMAGSVVPLSWIAWMMMVSCWTYTSCFAACFAAKWCGDVE